MRKKRVELIVSQMNFLMEVVVVLFCSCQLLLKLNLPKPQDILFMTGLIPLIQHVNQQTLTVTVSTSQPLSSHLAQLSPQPFLRRRLRAGFTRC
jgi:hypothetical protein